MKKNILKNSGVQSLLASLVCVILGLLIGYIVLLVWWLVPLPCKR